MSPNAHARSGNIYDDLERGEPGIPLKEMPKQPFVAKVNGRAPHISSFFRKAQSGELETVRGIGGKVTTRSAYFRFLSRNSGPRATPIAVSELRRRQIEAAHNRLAAAGIV